MAENKSNPQKKNPTRPRKLDRVGMKCRTNSARCDSVESMGYFEEGSTPPLHSVKSNEGFCEGLTW